MSRATMPARAPYVSPKSRLLWKNVPRPRVMANHRTSETPDPKASHDHAG